MCCWLVVWRPETRPQNESIVLLNETDERCISYSCGSDPGGRVCGNDAARPGALRIGAGGCVCRNRNALPFPRRSVPGPGAATGLCGCDCRPDCLRHSYHP